MRFVLGLALSGAAMLGGCGQPEAQIRDELRAQMLQRCNREIAPNTSALPNFDSDAYCRCVTDKAVGERSLAELKALFDDRARVVAAGREAGAECLAQQNANGAGVVLAPSSEPGNDAAPAPAPAREREKAREKQAEPAAPARPRIEEVKERPQPRTEPVAPPRATPPPRPEPEPAIDDDEEEANDRA